MCEYNYQLDTSFADSNRSSLYEELLLQGSLFFIFSSRIHFCCFPLVFFSGSFSFFPPWKVNPVQELRCNHGFTPHFFSLFFIQGSFCFFPLKSQPCAIMALRLRTAAPEIYCGRKRQYTCYIHTNTLKEFLDFFTLLLFFSYRRWWFSPMLSIYDPFNFSPS